MICMCYNYHAMQRRMLPPCSSWSPLRRLGGVKNIHFSSITCTSMSPINKSLQLFSANFAEHTVTLAPVGHELLAYGCGPRLFAASSDQVFKPALMPAPVPYSSADVLVAEGMFLLYVTMAVLLL